MLILLDRADIQRAYNFAIKSAPNQQEIEYGQHDTVKRDKKEIAKDTMVGKLGEIAIQKYLAEHKIFIELDENIYPRGQWDSEDILYNGWSLDIKCTQKKSHYLLVETNKLYFRTTDEELPHYFILTKLTEDISIDKLPTQTRIELCGYECIGDFHKGGPNVLFLPKDSCIPNTNTKLQAENLGVRIEDLNHDWDGFIKLLHKKPFTIKYPNQENHIEEKLTALQPQENNEQDSKDANYSLCIAGVTAQYMSNDTIKRYIQSGVKVHAFHDRVDYYTSRYKSLIEQYGKYDMFTFHPLSEGAHGKIVDGFLADDTKSQLLEKLKAHSKTFNKEQFEIEHADCSKDLIVKASAGTGKTKVMIDRILYLLSTVPSLTLTDIGMITFTNEAANSMRKKLAKAILKLYQATNNIKYYEWLEDLGNMQISTIDKFFKDIIVSQSTALGYGASASIRSLKYEKQQIIRDVMNDLFQENKPNTFTQDIVLSLENYSKLVLACWDKLNGRGYYLDTLQNIDFGDADEEATIINRNLKSILIEAEKRYIKLRKANNFIDINDLNEDMDVLTNQKHFMSNLRFKYLFVDEFQDTDNSQIRTIAWLKKMMKCSLFVVGDIKQSIYRFRGAEESAFERLKSLLDANNPPLEFTLQRNYRTLPHVLDNLNKLFATWGERDYLKWDGAIEANPMKTETGELHIVKYEQGNSKQTDRSRQKTVFTQVMQELKNEKDICVLNRTNDDVAAITRWCKELHIPCISAGEGGFFQSEPVQDVLMLLQALLYPDEPRAMYGFLLTPYTNCNVDIQKINQYAGKKEDLNVYFSSLMGNTWEELLYDSRRKPFFQLLRETIDKLNPIGHYKQAREAVLQQYGYTENQLQTQLQIDVETYRLNLYKLLEIFYNAFAGEFISLLSVYDFLKLKSDTDHQVDALYPTNFNADHVVTAMTIHKAKGLEFGTVILANMFDNVAYDMRQFAQYKNKPPFKSDFMINETANGLQLGWFVICRDKNYENDFYESNMYEERLALNREIARILYVALTRAMNKLYCLMPIDPYVDDIDDNYIKSRLNNPETLRDFVIGLEPYPLSNNTLELKEEEE